MILPGIYQMSDLRHTPRTINSKESERNEFFNAFLIGHLQLDIVSDQFLSCLALPLLERWCFTRCSPDAGLYIRLGATLLEEVLALASGFNDVNSSHSKRP